jgi:hypothetical protein
LALTALATPVLAYPTGSEALEARLLSKMGPSARAWIAKEGGHIASSRSISSSASDIAVAQYGATGANADALTFLVLMQADRDADKMVSGIASDDMSSAESKRDERQAELSRDVRSGSQRQQLSGGNQVVSEANAKPSVSLLPNQGTSTFTLKQQPTDPTVVTPPPGLNLQDAMDRESQIDDLVSDAMKRLSPSAEAAVTAMP